jgi:tetratricopeptide (TPR) repeat protein
MKFAQSTRILASLGWISFTSWSIGVAAMPTPAVSSQQPRGGILVACQMQQINQIRNPSDLHDAILNLLAQFTTGEDPRILEWIAALSPQEEIDTKANTLLWFAHFTRLDGNQAKARSLLSQALTLSKTRDRNPSLLREIGDELIAVGQPETAATALAASLHIAPGGADLGRAEFLFHLAKSYLALGQPATAVTLLDQSVQIVHAAPLQHKAGLLAKLSVRYGMAGATTKADALFAESLKLATASPDGMNAATQLLEVLRETASSTDPRELAPLPAAQQSQLLADQQQKSNQVQAQLLVTIKPLKNRSDILQNIALLWVGNHQLERAMQLAKNQPDPEDRFFMLIILLPNTPHPENPQQIQETLPLLAQTLAAAHSIQDASTRDSVLAQMADAYAAWGQRSQALQIMEGIQDQDQKQTAKVQIASSLALAGQPDQAFTLAQTLPPDTKDPELGLVPRKSAVLGKIALGYTKVGQLDRALQIIASMPPGAIRNQTLVDMTEALTRLGKSQQAATLLPQVTNAEIRYRALYNMVDILMTAGDLDAALALVQPPLPPNLLDSIHTTRQDLLRQIATAYAETGQYAKAISIAQMLPDQSLTNLFTCAQSASLKPH